MTRATAERLLQEAKEALDRLDARFPGPTGTNYHFDIDTIRTNVTRLCEEVLHR